MRKVKIAALLIVSIFVLTACKKNYTVTFNTDGGSKIEAIKVEKGGKVAKPTDPTKEGYTFTYWTLEGKEYDFSSKVTKDLTLVAKWNKKVEDEKEPEKSVCTKKCDSGYILTSECTCKKLTVTGVAVNKSALELEIGETFNITATVKPSGVINTKVTFTSSNTSVAKVDEYGKVTGLTPGKATITVTTDENAKKAYVTVTVLDEYEYTSAKLDESDISYTVYIYKNGSKVTDEQLASINAVYTADGKYLGRYEESIKAIMVDKSQVSSIGKIKVNNKEYKIKEKKAV